MRRADARFEVDFRNDLPGFSAARVLGENFDQFHKNAGRQRSLLSNLKGEHRAQIQIGGLHMRLIANPIADDDGERLGSVIEWLDRTAEVNAENEIGGIVAAAAAGDFTKRIEETDKIGLLPRNGAGPERDPRHERGGARAKSRAF